MRRAVVFDLLTALLDSWALWDAVAGRDARLRYLELTFAAGAYRPYEELVTDAVGDAATARTLLGRWDELAPWPEARAALTALRERGVRIGVATNCSVDLGRRAAARVGVPFDAVVTAEEAGAYKPQPPLYLATAEALGATPDDALFVAGSPGDVTGATNAGFAEVAWHNRAGLDLGANAEPTHRLRTLLDLLAL